MTTVLMTHFIMKAPPPHVTSAILERAMTEKLNVIPFKPDYEEFLKRCEKVGDGWHLRSEHLDINKVNRTRARLQSAKSAMWLFMKDDEEIGFCVAVKDGFNGISEKFNIAGQNGTEIYKVGLYPEHTHKGYGQLFLPTIMSKLLKGQRADNQRGIKAVKPSDIIYLNTRDSNNVDSRDFYRRLGMQLVGNEQWIEPGSEATELDYELVRTSRVNGNSKPPIDVRGVGPIPARA